jgi:hypothetical protein
MDRSLFRRATCQIYAFFSIDAQIGSRAIAINFGNCDPGNI